MHVPVSARWSGACNEFEQWALCGVSYITADVRGAWPAYFQEHYRWHRSNTHRQVLAAVLYFALVPEAGSRLSKTPANYAKSQLQVKCPIYELRTNSARALQGSVVLHLSPMDRGNGLFQVY